MQTISKAALDKISGNQKAIGRLMALFNKSSDTITRWINNRDIRLTTLGAVEIIREESGLPENEILEAATADAA